MLTVSLQRRATRSDVSLQTKQSECLVTSTSAGFRWGIPPAVRYSYKLFWNWNGVVQFVSREVWFDEGFVMWNFHNYCLVQTVSLWSLSVGVEIVFTTDELADRIGYFISNAPRFKKILYEKNAPQARFIMKQNAPQARPMKLNPPQAIFFD